MSDNKEVSLLPTADFTMKDLELIEKFKENGMLGLHTLTEVDAERMMGLYMDGKSYRQIAQVTKKNKSIILFLAHKFKWFELRKEYLDELQATLKEKIVESKLQSQEFLLELVLAYQKKVSKNVHQYLRTDNAEFADQIDPKDINTVLKVMELLHKLSAENLGEKPPLVGLSGMGEGMTITKTGANSVEITPKSPFSNKLKQFAEMKREQERASQPVPKQPHDIDTKETLTPTKENKDE
jgi:uncharacterized protein YnzC (UPF0291/DUF896 family)